MKCDKSQRWLQCTDKKTTFKQGEQGDTPKTWLYDTTICSVSVQDPKNMTQKGIRCKKDNSNEAVSLRMSMNYLKVQSKV